MWVREYLSLSSSLSLSLLSLLSLSISLSLSRLTSLLAVDSLVTEFTDALAAHSVTSSV